MEKITATYDQDCKGYHRFIIDRGQGVVGNIYVPKGEDVPDLVKVQLCMKAESEARK